MITFRIYFLVFSCLLVSCNWAFSSDRFSQCFSLSENKEKLASEPDYQLCMVSADLDRYSHSVVTFVLAKYVNNEQELNDNADQEMINDQASQENKDKKIQRSLASLKKDRKLKVLAKRHYQAFSKFEFGRNCHEKKPSVSFDRKEKTVFLKFFGKDGKQFFYLKNQNANLQSLQISGSKKLAENNATK